MEAGGMPNQSTIPVPLVKSPRIYAPASARDPHSVMPPPDFGKESFFEEITEKLPLPDFLRDSVFKGVSLINHVVFKASKPGASIPEQPGSWKFSAIGDYGSGSQALNDVTDNIARSNPKLVLTLGDNVYWNGTEKDFQKRWDPPNYFGDIRKNFPVMPALGNHDLASDPTGAPYFKRFPELKNARYYMFNKGGVHFVALNSNESLAPGSPQYKWLEKDLAKAKDDWKVVYFHHPMYSAYRQQKTPLKEHLGPLMAKYGVNLLLTGHEHNYTRTKALNDAGTVEIISGGGGHTLYPFTEKQGPIVAYRDVEFGHVNFEVTKDKLIGRYVVRDGSVRDTFVIEKETAPSAPSSDAAAGAAQVTK